MRTNKQQNTLWTGSFIKICLVNFFIFVNFHALLTTFPFYVEQLGGGAIAIGLATALLSLASIISRPFIGWLVDTKGRCTMLVVGLIGMAAMPMGYFVSAGIAMALIMRTIHGAALASCSNASGTWVTDIIEPKRIGEGLGMYGLSMAISTAIAPALGLTLMNQLGFGALFGAGTVAAVVALALGLSIRPRSYRLSSAPLRLSQLLEKRSVPASLTQFFFMVTYGVIEVYVAIYAAQTGLPSGGLFFVVIALATVLTRVGLGKVIDRKGEAPLVYSGNAAIILGTILLVGWHSEVAYVVSAALIGYSFGAVQPAMQTMAMHAVAPERRGAASSTFFVAFDLGIALGGFVAGVLAEHLGYDAMFLIISVFSLLSATYYFLFARRHPSSLNPEIRQRIDEVV